MIHAPLQHKILILIAIHHGWRLDKEVHSIEECIRFAARQDIFEINVRTVVRSQDIPRAITEEKPQIIHSKSKIPILKTRINLNKVDRDGIDDR